MPVKSTVIPERPEYRPFPPGPSAEGARAVAVTMLGRFGDLDPRGYPKHARSLTARAARQRMLLLAVILGIAASASLVALPRVFRPHGADHRQAGTGPSLDASARARNLAAAWVGKWVSRSADVACDPGMCQLLEAHDVSSGEIWPMAPGATDPLDAVIVVETPTIRSQFGPRLMKVYAPAVLASFGTGSIRVEVRVVAAGAARYERQLRTDVTARRSAGAALLRNPGLAVAGQARGQLASGEVDSRLLTNLAALVHWGNPVSVLGFGGAGPGASRGMPVLSMEITPIIRRQPGGALTPARRAASIARAVTRILRFLRAQIAPLNPASVSHWRSAGGQLVVRVDFGAPTQFGVFGGRPVETMPIAKPPPG